MILHAYAMLGVIFACIVIGAAIGAKVADYESKNGRSFYDRH